MVTEMPNITEIDTTAIASTAMTTTTTQVTTPTTIASVVHRDGLGDPILNLLLNGGGVVVGDIKNTLSNVNQNIQASLEDIAGANDVWTLGLHQVLLFFLVIGRWLLPRGGIR